jgi:5-methylthioadenosine/S-adenosylhomocysteine deaminase
MGTDGLWSSPSMNLFQETMVAVRLHGFDGASALRLATLEGARAMGVEHEAGRLEPGKWADFAVVEALPDGSDPELTVLEAAAGGGVAATVAGGDVIYNRTEA